MSRDILLSEIDRDPEQPRTVFDEASIDELAASMAESGQAVAIMVRPAGNQYVIVHGERRWRAAQRLGWSTIRAEVRDVAAADVPWLALVENIQRADLSPIEEARAYQRMVDAGHTQTAIGKRIGKTQSYIAQKLRLLKMPEFLQYYLSAGMLSEGHCREILRLERIYCADIREEFTEHQSWSEVVESIGDEEIAGYAFGVVMRPLDQPSFFLFGKGKHAAHRPAIELFFQHVERCGWRPPSWARVAMYYAAYAAEIKASVVMTSEMIDRFQDSFYAAVASIYNNLAPSDLPSTMYWDYLSDYRHATRCADPESIPDALLLSALKHTALHNSIAYPTAWQEYGIKEAVYNTFGKITGYEMRSRGESMSRDMVAA